MPRRSAIRSSSTLALIVVASLAIGACGGGSSAKISSPAAGGQPLQLVQAAATRTEASGTARSSLSIGADFSGLPSTGGSTSSPSGSFLVGATGAFDFAAKRSRLDIDLSHLPAELRSGLHGQHLVMIVDQGTVYVNAAGLGVKSSKPWIKLETASIGGGSFDLSQLAQAGPSQSLALLKQFGEVTVAGHEHLRGVQTTHYAAKLDLGKALGSLGGTGAGGGLLGGNGQGANAFGGATVPVEVWLDDIGRVRKMTTQLDLLPLLRVLFGAFGGLASQFGQSGTTVTAPTLPPTAKAQLSLTFELFDFGAKVDVAPPPADQVGPPPAGFTLPGAGLPGASTK